MYSVAINLRSPKDWREKVQLFVSKLESIMGGRLVSVIALPSEEELLYDSNVLVVLDEIREGDLERVASVAPDGVNPLVVPEEDEGAVEAFLLLGGKRLGPKEEVRRALG